MISAGQLGGKESALKRGLGLQAWAKAAGPHGAATPIEQTIWSLQTLRFAAAMMVVYFHAANAAFSATGSYGLLPYNFHTTGAAGVDIFFVLSGVIITKTARGLSWREFAWRRFRRIAPMYFLVTLLAVLCRAKPSFGWRDALANLFLWPATDQLTWPALQPAWTLCFEMLFYAAVTAVLVDRRLLYVIVGIFGVAMLLRKQGPMFQFLGSPLILEFIFGVALAYMPRWRLAVCFLPIGAAALVIAGLSEALPEGGLAGNGPFLRVCIYGVPAAMIVLGTMQIDAKPSAWTFLGDASYTLYLTHVLPIGLLLLWCSAHPAAPDLIILIGSASAVVFAWRMYVLFEIPLLTRLGRRMGPVY